MGSLGSHLYIPADSDRKVSSASRIAADSFILDLEERDLDVVDIDRSRLVL